MEFLVLLATAERVLLPIFLELALRMPVAAAVVWLQEPLGLVGQEAGVQVEQQLQLLEPSILAVAVAVLMGLLGTVEPLADQASSSFATLTPLLLQQLPLAHRL
jgi:hypothetical protein